MSVYHEVFVSPFEKDTQGEALQVLQAIRECHSAYYGWREIRGFVEQLPNGKWRAVREHEQIKDQQKTACHLGGQFFAAFSVCLTDI